MNELSPHAIIWPLILVMVSIVSIVGGVLSVIFAAKRKPPLPEEIAKCYVSKSEFQALENRTKAEISALESRSERYMATVSKLLGDIQRSLGVIEGELKGLHRERTKP